MNISNIHIVFPSYSLNFIIIAMTSSYVVGAYDSDFSLLKHYYSDAHSSSGSGNCIVAWIKINK